MAETPISILNPAKIDRSKLLVEHGFIKKDKDENYVQDKDKKTFKPVEGYPSDSEYKIGNDADEEETEILNTVFGKTGYPVPVKAYKLMWEVNDLSLEEPYFWILDTLKDAFPEIMKLEDSFAAAENSAFFGVSQQRLGGQQDKVSQYLATMGKMIKELFQMVRELRIYDERLTYYEKVEKELDKEMSKRSKSDDITLKGIFVDLVQQGAKSAASVFGMARELEFVTLPDLFFDAPPFKDEKELNEHVKSLEKDFNASVLRVLVRHLNQYLVWRKATYKEQKNRKIFLLKYLRQHFDIVRMYLEWVKPYLRHVSRLSMKEGRMASADIVSAFEGSLLDIEILAKKNSGDAFSCILATFNYRTRPELKFAQEGYQRGPVHIGRVEINLRAYGWTKDEIENYQRLKEKETLLLISEVSASVYEAMTSLGEDLEKYIKEARGETEDKDKDKNKDTKKTEKKKTFMEKFFGDFYDTSKAKDKSKNDKSKSNPSSDQIKKAKKEAGKGAAGVCWPVYNNFKKSHGMIAW